MIQQSSSTGQSDSAMRDPQGDLHQYAVMLDVEIRSREKMARHLPGLPLKQVLYRLAAQFWEDQKYVLYRYGQGVPLAVLAQDAAACTRAMLADLQFVQREGGELYAGICPVEGAWRWNYGLAAMVLLLADDPQLPAAFTGLMSEGPDQRTYLFDLLVKAFVPGRPIAAHYHPNRYALPWSEPVVRALALPPAQQGAALARHMENWPRLMRPYGWKPALDFSPGRDRLFCDFAFEVALAVCGWDIDDSGLAHHPYYPRDLVAWYRARIRHGRDAWRAHQAGAGVGIAAPPLPTACELAGSTRHGLARWIELAADGDQDATDAVLEAVGNPPVDLDELACALGDADIALYADIEDDETLAAQIDAVSAARGLGVFDEPAAPPSGRARCSALLRAWEAWLAERGYRLAAAELEGAWHALVVRTACIGEFQALAGTFAIALRASGEAFKD